MADSVLHGQPVAETIHETLLPIIRDETVSFYGGALVSLAVFGSVARGSREAGIRH